MEINILDLKNPVNHVFWYSTLMWMISFYGKDNKLIIPFEDLSEYWNNPTYFVSYSKIGDGKELQFVLGRKLENEIPE